MLGGLFKSLVPTRDDAERRMRVRLDAWESWLLPLAGDGGVGRDPGYEDLFFALREETQKLSGIDNGRIARSCCNQHQRHCQDP